MSGAQVLTFGCRLNLAEGESVRAAAGPAGDLVVVNSCAVTQEAVRQAEKAVRRAHRDRPDARIVVTGCAAQLEPARFAAMPGVARVLGNAEKLLAESYRDLSPSIQIPSSPRRPGSMALSTRDGSTDGERHGPLPAQGRRADVAVADIFADRSAPAPAATFADRSRAFVQVQAGCGHRCTFCIIPFARGHSRSVPAGAAIDRIAALVDAGAREVVLTGVDLTGYGADLAGGATLGGLVERILRAVPRLARLRLSSLDTVEIDPLLGELIAAEPRLMPHLHLSLQSGDDMILKRMRRRHGRAHAIELVATLKARRPELAIGADLIAGFPTETAAMAANSLALIEACDIVFAHVFPFSPRQGTPAARMPQIEPEVARERARRLREAAAARRGAWLAGLVGTTQRVLMERGRTGHAENFAKVRLASSALALDRHPREGGDPWAAARPKVEESASMDSRLRGNDRVGVGDVRVGDVVNLRIVALDGDTLVGVPA